MSSPRRGRRPVFNPNALDDLDDTLGPPDPTPAPVANLAPVSALADSPPEPDDVGGDGDHGAPAVMSTSTLPTEASTARPTSPDRPTPTSPTPERGALAGRPRPAAPNSARAHAPTSRQPRSPRGRIATAVRLPADLYREVNEVLLSGSERPSYGQLVMWTVEDHREDVADQVDADLPDPTDRVPRGRKLAQDRMPVGLQLLSTERDELDDIAARIAERRGDTRVTRTDVAIAALRVALRTRSTSR